MVCQSHFSQHNRPDRIWRGLVFLKYLIMHFSPTYLYFLTLKHKCFLKALPLFTRSLFPSLYVRDKVLHPYKTRDRIMLIVLYILIFLFLADGKTKLSEPNDSKLSPNLMVVIFLMTVVLTLSESVPNISTILHRQKLTTVYFHTLHVSFNKNLSTCSYKGCALLLPNSPSLKP